MAEAQHAAAEIDPWRAAVRQRDVDALCGTLFDVDLYPSQEEIVKTIAFRESDLVVNTYTRYGKTFSVGLGTALLIQLNRFRGLDIGILGPNLSDATNLKDELLRHGIRNDVFAGMIDTGRGSDPEDLLKSRSADKITFNDGATTLRCLSAKSAGAHGDRAGAGAGSGLMGEGFDVLILEEAAQIPQSVWENYAARLLEEVDSTLIELGNPWHKGNQFYRHWEDRENFRRVHVDEEQGIKEGRHPPEWFDDQAREVGGRDTIQYTVLYESRFPDEVEDALISQRWLDDARDADLELDDRRAVYGLDAAGEGDDVMVLTRAITDGTRYKVTHQFSRDHTSDTGRAAQWALQHVERYDRPEDATVVVDYIGIGAGVWSKLNEEGVDAVKFKAGETPRRQLSGIPDCRDEKAQKYHLLAAALEEGRVALADDLPGELALQLTHITAEPNSRGDMVVNDPDSGSPDFADSLMLVFAERDAATITGVGGRQR
ncbi:MAG: hypothetical protein SVU88_03485 [Candidatus Nanohaloarchaea archaeon]|nr:hypothetical protein [Candidatus Nanohaloarchaea archaeon]